MERFDALVVGAGPSGSSVACRLARAGASVLLVDRVRFPRDKPCGGGLTYRAVRELPVAVDPVVEDIVDRVEFRLSYGRRFARTSPAPLCLMTQRSRLDAHLAAAAVAAGADFRDGVRVSALTLAPQGVTARVGSVPVAADVLVGADGANGVTARTLGLGADYGHGVALEANVPFDAVDRRLYQGKLVIEVRAVSGGYGWVFPKGDHVNVGVGGWASEGPRLREHLRRLCREHGIAESALAGLRGHRLPLRRPRSPVVKGRAALVGDAAGLVDPLSGDGLYEALGSARLAAAAVVELLSGRTADLHEYELAVSEIVALSDVSWKMKLALDRFPRLVFAIAEWKATWRVVQGIVRGEISGPGDVRGLGRMPLRMVEALAGVSRPGTLEAWTGAPIS